MAKKILFITLSNIGDVILTLPALDALREKFPEGKITVMVGPRPKEIFENDPAIAGLIVYDKHANLGDQIKLFRRLWREKFDLVVDLRNSLFGAFLFAKCRTSPFLHIPKSLTHMQKRHFYRGQAAWRKMRGTVSPEEKIKSLYVSPGDKEDVQKIFHENGIKRGEKIIIIAAGARSHIKRWPQNRFRELIAAVLKDFQAHIILVGDKDDAPINKYIAEGLPHRVLDLSGKTSLTRLAGLLSESSLLIANDSAILHLASYLNISVVTIFGPTNELKYGPWSENSVVVKKDIFCRPCEKAQCRFGTLDCMKLVKVGDVYRAVKIVHSPQSTVHSLGIRAQGVFKRILIVRTDRIGDVLLSTPVIKALRSAYPDAYLAMMVSPYAKDIVEGNPYLDDVIVYDKEGLHRKWSRSFGFAMELNKKKFDLVIILHPTNRAHLVTFLAGIPKRVGYDRKLGFLLNNRLKHTKHLGQKHELEYNLDLVRYLGIAVEDKSLLMPIRDDSEEWVDGLWQRQGIKKEDKILALHPGASCPSKIWPAERFAQAADKLIQKYGFKVLLIAGPKDVALADQVMKNMRQAAINLASQTSVSQLASLLARCCLVISNDSGPVHIATAVGTPVISIFGRNQLGLSPLRWGPVGEKDKVLHKEVGCIQCLAHNCKKDFACLKAITVDDVVSAADEILRG